MNFNADQFTKNEKKPLDLEKMRIDFERFKNAGLPDYIITYLEVLSKKNYSKFTSKLYIPIPHIPWNDPAFGVPISIISSPVLGRIF